MSKIITTTLGIVFIIIAILTNQWVFEYFYKIDGGIQLAIEKITLWTVSLSCLIFGFIFIFRRKSIANMILLVVSFGLSLLVAEWFVGRNQDVQYSGEKTYVQSGERWGNCYPLVEDTHLPIKRIDPNTGKDAACVIYDTELRKKGYYAQRNQHVAIIGDSFTFGEGVREEDTLGFILGKEFDQYNFVNYGQPGTDIVYMYQVFNYLLEHKPEVKNIVYFYNINDVLMDTQIAQEQKYITDFQNVRWQNTDKTQTPVSEFFAHSSLYNFVKNVMLLRKESDLTVQNYLDMYDPQLNKTELDKTVSLLMAMNKTAQSKGVHFTVVMYPLLYKDPLGQYPFVPIHNLVKQVCEQHGINYIDAFPAFQSVGSLRKLTVHPLDYHPNGEANTHVVRYLKEVDKQKSIFQ